VAQNPIVIMTMLGLLYNLLLKGRLPEFAFNLLSAFGNLFPTLAIFLLGINM
jgi:hypothetical protein